MQPEGANQPSSDWEWITGEPFIFTAWADGEPNDFGCSGEEGCENCLEGGFDGALWNDNSCETTLNCIVEFDVSIASRPIPTISEWGLIAMAGLMGIVGYIVLRRRKVAA
jgi:hypothetical protein